MFTLIPPSTSASAPGTKGKCMYTGNQCQTRTYLNWNNIKYYSWILLHLTPHCTKAFNCHYWFHFKMFLQQIDLVPPEVVTAWKHYFMSKFEQLSIVCFTSFPKDESERNRDPSKGVVFTTIHDFKWSLHWTLWRINFLFGFKFLLNLRRINWLMTYGYSCRFLTQLLKMVDLDFIFFCVCNYPFLSSLHWLFCYPWQFYLNGAAVKDVSILLDPERFLKLVTDCGETKVCTRLTPKLPN